MPPFRRLQAGVLVPVVFSIILFPATAHAIKVVTWNILNYPGSTGGSREDDYRVVLQNIHPDLLITQEMTGSTSAGMTQFLNNVLNTVYPGEYAAGPWVNGPDTDNSLYYRTSVVDFISNQNISGGTRDISEYVVRPDGYLASAANLFVYSGHLKAGNTSEDESQRQAECTILRNHLNALPAGTHFIFGGDYNVYSSSDLGYVVLTQSQADNDGRCFDPINTPGAWNNNGAFALIHSQSTRTTVLPDGGASGGLDDRFDIWLQSSAMQDNEGLSYVSGTYETYGNDGLHFNDDITDPPTIPEGAAVATALYNAADHMPVVMEIQVPARVNAVASLNFGTVIVGAVANQTLNVSNGAIAPADELSYTLSAPAGFTAPGGSFAANAGAPGNNHTIGMTTGAAGNKNGNLTINSDDVDSPSRLVALSGTVLSHAVPAMADADPVDWGTHPAGMFTDQPAGVANTGYNSLQARLDVYSGNITGTDAARFSIVGGFTPSLVEGTPASYTLHFDDTGASPGTYTASLTFQTRDEQGIPGAVNLADVAYNLTATVDTQSGSPEPGEAPAVTRLIGNHPNPFNPSTVIAFDISRPGPARLSIYDVRGRLVIRLVDRHLEPGRFEIPWNGRDSSGTWLGSGVYYYQLEADGVRQTQSMVMAK